MRPDGQAIFILELTFSDAGATVAETAAFARALSKLVGVSATGHEADPSVLVVRTSSRVGIRGFRRLVHGWLRAGRLLDVTVRPGTTQAADRAPTASEPDGIAEEPADEVLVETEVAKPEPPRTAAHRILRRKAALRTDSRSPVRTAGHAYASTMVVATDGDDQASDALQMGRYVDVVMLERDGAEPRTEHRKGPLRRGEWYTLEVHIRGTRQGIAVLGDTEITFREPETGDDRDIDLTVTIDCVEDDFEIDEHTQQLVLPRHGDTRDPATFRIKPTRLADGDDPLRLQIRIFWGLRLLDAAIVHAAVTDQGTSERDTGSVQLEYIGDLASQIEAGSPDGPELVISVSRHQERYRLSFLFQGVDGKAEFVGGTGVGVEPETLDQHLARMRRKLWLTDQDPVYDEGLSAGKKYEKHLRAIAEDGRDLWGEIFEKERDSALWEIGQTLMGLPLERGSRITVLVDRSAATFSFPWAMLNDVDPDEATAEELFDGFWGTRYVVTQLPPGLTPLDRVERSGPPTVSCLYWPFADHYKEHLDEVRAFAEATSATLQPAASVNQAAAARKLLKGCPSWFIYFYAHGYTERRANSGIPDFLEAFGQLPEDVQRVWEGARRRLADDQDRRSRIDLSLGSLILNQLRRGDNLELLESPIVFLNMCESAQVAPSLSDSFVRLFLDRGAQTVLGTECAVRPGLAKAVAREVFDEMAAGCTVGEALRRSKVAIGLERESPLALAYTMYGSSEASMVM